MKRATGLESEKEIGERGNEIEIGTIIEVAEERGTGRVTGRGIGTGMNTEIETEAGKEMENVIGKDQGLLDVS